MTSMLLILTIDSASHPAPHTSVNELIPRLHVGTWHWFVFEKRQMKNNFYVNDKCIEIYLIN